MNLVYGLALHEFSVAQWIGCPPEVWEVIGLNPVRDSDFFLFHARFHLHICSPSLKFTVFHSFTKSEKGYIF